MSPNINADTITTLDDDLRKIEFAYVLNIRNGNWSITDHNGFSHLPSQTRLGDSLEVQRYGYETVTFFYDGGVNIITLNTSPLALKTVSVSISEIMEPTKIVKTAGHENISHKEHLGLLPGVQIKTFGGPGSISTVSINGGATSQTKVTLNGFDLSNMQTGVTDLSQLPSAYINHARIINSGHKLISSGSQNGLLELYTWEPNNTFSFSRGSFNSTTAYVKLFLQSKLINTSIIMGDRYDEGNFNVSWKDEEFRRQNNYLNQSYGSIQLDGRLNNNLFFKSLTLLTKQKRGVPGQIWSPSNASHNDNLLIHAASMSWISNSGKNELKFMYRASDDTYEDPLYSIVSNNYLDRWSLDLSKPLSKTRNSLLDFLISAQRHLLYSNQKKYNKDIYTLNINYLYRTSFDLTIKPSLQTNYSPNFFNKNTYSLLLVYDFKGNFLDKLSLSSSSHFRHPTFNDLYWQPGGNPRLEPEYGTNQSVNLKFRENKFGKVDLLCFRSITDNLIQWVPIQSYWQANNLNNARRLGVVGNWTKSTQTSQIRFSFNLNKSNFGDDNKPLRYSPARTFTWQFKKEIKSLILSLNAHYTGKMISMYSYPTDNIIPSNTTTSIYASKEYQFRYFGAILGCSVLNLLNKKYESSKGYPEHGRAFVLSLTINQGSN